MKEEQTVLTYFRQPGFERFLELLERQYTASKDGARGYVTITNITDVERSTLDGFYGTYSPPVPGENRRYSLRKFEKLLKLSRFELSVPELLALLRGEPVLTRQEQMMRIHAEWRNCIQAAVEEADAAGAVDPRVLNWTQGLIEETGPGARTLRTVFAKSPEEARQCLKSCVMALGRAARQQDNRPIRLPVLSAAVTGDAHALDWKTPLGRLFWWGLTAVQDQSLVVTTDESQLDQADLADSVTSQAIIIREGYRRGGVADDDLSSQVMWCAPELFGIREERVLTLRQVERLSAERVAKMRFTRIYMVENPSVFAELVDADANKLGGTNDDFQVIVCGNGQPSMAVIRLLDTLLSSREGVALFYAGDLDPAGLGIAQSLQLRYPQAFRPWRMDKEHYLQYAHRGMPLTANERSRLQEGRCGWDTALVEAMKDAGFKLHQELWLEELIRDLA